MCEHSHHITHHKPKEENTKKKFLGRVLGPDGILTTSHIITSHHIRHHKPKRQKSTSFLVKTSFKSIAEHRKVRELPRKMNIEEVEEPKKYENLQTKPVLDPFKSTADHLKVRELARKTNIEEVEEPETTKIYRSIEAPWQITPPVACLKGHSCEKCLSNYVPGLDLKMQKHVSSILSYFFSNEIPLLQHTSRCSDCKKVWKARAMSAWHGIAGGVESPC